MSFNLLTDPFLPVRTADGGRRVMRLTGLFAAEDAVEPDWPRGDFNAAAFEFLIGIVSVALAPMGLVEWRAGWATPPADWAARLAPLAPAFELFGDGARFLQEFGGLDGDPTPIEALLIDTPGANGQRKTSDLLTHRGRTAAMAPAEAAMALYTLQAFAPTGGAGNMTSMRGGGPLSVLVVPQGAGGAPVPLWRKVWANLAPQIAPVGDLRDVFAWLGPRRVKGKVHADTPGFHPLHSHFGMPRRMTLMADGQGNVTGFVQKPHGLDYGLWQHPMTPYRQVKPDSEPYSVKPNAQVFRARDWVDVARRVGDLRSGNVRALKERENRLTAGQQHPEPRLRVAGWNMNNMEAVSFLEAELPLHLVADAGRQYDLDALAVDMANAADQAAFETRRHVRRAVFGDGTADTGKGVLDAVSGEVLDAADRAFHEILAEAQAAEPGPGPFGDHGRAEFAACWLALLRRAALAAFDRAAPVPLHDPARAGRIVEARRRLVMSFGSRAKLAVDLG
ncbi:type I-E CRISPR-associated protein Cse1/CasA, partial [Tropicimonas sp.]|uniref:type I-E CRISPR-associated protein Cse1/CasA n=1 Tax=Tropicimonas sp. TaxID=2067044 RepID=UPI003A89BC6A